MKFTKTTLAAVLLAATGFIVSAQAQDADPPGIAARVAFLSGQVSLEAQGVDYWSSAPMNYPMVGGDRIYTSSDAHAALQIGSTDLRLWGSTDLTLTNLNERYQQIGIAAGSVHVRVFAVEAGNVIEVDTPNGAIIIQNPGDYRVNVYPDQQSSLVQVDSGVLQITGPGMNQEVDQGQAVQLYGVNPVEIGLIDTLPPDDFDAWCMQRDRHILNSVSARYVNRYVPGYDDLDDYGDWVAVSEYGPIWFPRSTPYGWQPYSTGHWAYVQPWGYTWVDDAPWGYAPFHYGRWVVWQGRWGWVPGPPAVRPVYAPAFVAFVGGGGGVTAWFPLGVAEPFVPWYQCSPAYVRTVNVTNVNITVIHNVTVVNNYNVFINHVTTVRSVNEIQVKNINYVNRTHVLAVNSNAMTSGVRVQQAVVHLNGEQQQSLMRAPVALARPPVAPPAHPVVGVRASTPVAVARPVLMTTRGRVVATSAANTAHFEPRALPKPAPATAIRPATHAVVPNVRPATAPVNAGRNGQPNNVTRPAQPVNNARPEQQPAFSQPAARPTAPENNNRPAQPGTFARPEQQPAYLQPASRPAPPENNRPVQPAMPNRTESQPVPNRNELQPAQPHSVEPARPNEPAPYVRPSVPENNRPPETQPTQSNRPATDYRSAPPPNHPPQETRPTQPEARPAPFHPAPQAKNLPTPEYRPAPPPNRPPQPTHPAQPEARPEQMHPAPLEKNQLLRPEDKNNKPPKDEHESPKR